MVENPDSTAVEATPLWFGPDDRPLFGWLHTPVGGVVRGGAATVLDLPLDPTRTLHTLAVRAIANEVVIGVMSVTLAR